MAASSGPGGGSGPVRVTYTVGDKTQPIQCELLVVACDPRALLGSVMTATPQETEAFSDLTDFTFHTTIVTAKVPKDRPPRYGAVLDPDAVEAWRDEIVAAMQTTLDDLRAAGRHGLFPRG